MADYRENVNRLSAVQWPAGLRFQIGTVSKTAFSDFWNFRAKDSLGVTLRPSDGVTAADFQKYFVGQTSGAEVDFRNMQPGSSSAVFFALCPGCQTQNINYRQIPGGSPVPSPTSNKWYGGSIFFDVVGDACRASAVLVSGHQPDADPCTTCVITQPHDAMPGFISGEFLDALDAPP
jgi:hypothetical protein